VFFLTLYSLGLRLSERLNLTISDIDSETMQVHLRNAKGGKDRIVPLPEQTLLALRAYWKAHRHARLLFPGKGSASNSPMDKGTRRASRICPCCQHKMHFTGVTRTP